MDHLSPEQVALQERVDKAIDEISQEYNDYPITGRLMGEVAHRVSVRLGVEVIVSSAMVDLDESGVPLTSFVPSSGIRRPSGLRKTVLIGYALTPHRLV